MTQQSKSSCCGAECIEGDRGINGGNWVCKECPNACSCIPSDCMSRKEVLEFVEKWGAELLLAHEFSFRRSSERVLSSGDDIVTLGMNSENEFPEVKLRQKTDDFLKDLQQFLKSVKHHMGER